MAKGENKNRRDEKEDEHAANAAKKLVKATGAAFLFTNDPGLTDQPHHFHGK